MTTTATTSTGRRIALAGTAVAIIAGVGISQYQPSAKEPTAAAKIATAKIAVTTQSLPQSLVQGNLTPTGIRGTARSLPIATDGAAATSEGLEAASVAADPAAPAPTATATVCFVDEGSPYTYETSVSAYAEAVGGWRRYGGNQEQAQTGCTTYTIIALLPTQFHAEHREGGITFSAASAVYFAYPGTDVHFGTYEISMSANPNMGGYLPDLRP